jgi:hypothetical protein
MLGGGFWSGAAKANWNCAPAPTPAEGTARYVAWMSVKRDG